MLSTFFFFHRIWGSYNTIIYDLTDYAWTLNLNNNQGLYDFLDEDLVAVFRQMSGQDVTEALNAVLATMNTTYRELGCEGHRRHGVAGTSPFLGGQGPTGPTPV